jgi:hypothetical protein
MLSGDFGVDDPFCRDNKTLDLDLGTKKRPKKFRDGILNLARYDSLAGCQQGADWRQIP